MTKEIEDDEFDMEALEAIANPQQVTLPAPVVLQPPVAPPVIVTPVVTPVAEPRIVVRAPKLAPSTADKPGLLDDNRVKTVAVLTGLGVLGLVSLLVLVLLVRSFWPAGGGSDIGISIDGVAVRIIEDEARNPRKDWKPGMAGTLVTIRNWAAKNTAKTADGNQAYLAGDIQQDTSKLDPLWNEMAKASKLPPPVVLVLSGRRFTEFPLPADDKTALEKLNAAK